MREFTRHEEDLSVEFHHRLSRRIAEAIEEKLREEGQVSSDQEVYVREFDISLSVNSTPQIAEVVYDTTPKE